MLNRRQIRIKALQTLYSHFQSGDIDIQNTEKFLKSSMDKLYDLYIYQLSLLVEVVDAAENRLEERRNKLLPTDEDLKPNTKFIDNRFIFKLRNNKHYQKEFARLKINWSNYPEQIRKVLVEVLQADYYQKYMESTEDSFKADKDILIEIARKVLNDNEVFVDIFEEKYFLWSEDYYIGWSFVLHTLNELDEKWGVDQKLPSLYKASYDKDGKNEDENFLFTLVRKTILNRKKYDEIIEGKAKNWDFDRLATIDLILLRMGMAEIFEFDSIPLKVTLNEIIELAKYFSSPKSNIFINGILDKTIEEGLKNGTVVKKGRGLIGQN